MAEVQNQEASLEAQEAPKVSGKLVGAGQPQTVDAMTINPQVSGKAAAAVDESSSQAEGTQTGNEPAASQQADQTSQSDQPETPKISQEELKAFFEKSGIEFDGDLEALKTKLSKSNSQQPTNENSVEETEEQKAQKAQAFERRMLDFYLQNGGTAEQFVTLKNVASMDLTELSVSELKRELKGNNFSDEEIDLILKERYYQLDEEELEQYDDETEKDFLKRKKEHFSKMLGNRSAPLKNQATGILEGLKESVLQLDSLEQAEKEFSSKVDEHLKAVPRKMTFQLGESNDKQIDPIEYEVDEAVITEVSNILKDRDQREKLFFNEHNGTNLQTLSDLLIKNKILESALKKAYLEGGTRQVSEYEKVLHSSPQSLGTGGSSSANGKKGKIVSAGKPVVANKL